MNKIVEALKNTGVFYIATENQDQPEVRPFSSVTEFEGNAYICTNNTKEVYKQIMNNSKVALSGMSKDGSWIRIKATLVNDPRREAKQAMLQDPTGPSNLYTLDDGIFEVFRLENVECIRYSMKSEPEEIKA